jgi:hypothetical protein
MLGRQIRIARKWNGGRMGKDADGIYLLVANSTPMVLLLSRLNLRGGGGVKTRVEEQDEGGK